ncbi:MAG: DUF4007 family protein [Elainella sp. C42_A2020_010]|nr:DUF4007 family protein [Elainella sp. C42_A2020_010]
MAVEQANRNTDTGGNAKASVFARHETFHPRFGWLKKGSTNFVSTAIAKPPVFLSLHLERASDQAMARVA